MLFGKNHIFGGGNVRGRRGGAKGSGASRLDQKVGPLCTFWVNRYLETLFPKMAKKPPKSCKIGHISVRNCASHFGFNLFWRYFKLKLAENMQFDNMYLLNKLSLVNIF